MLIFFRKKRRILMRGVSLCGISVVFVAIAAGAFGAVRGDDVLYIGGTITAVPEKTEGRLDTSDTVVATFTAKKASFRIPYEKITGLEYGQKAGRRVGV